MKEDINPYNNFPKEGKMNRTVKIGLIVLSCIVSFAILVAGAGFILLVAWVVNENEQQRVSENKNDTSESQSPQKSQQKKEKSFKSSLNNKVLEFAIKGWHDVEQFGTVDKWKVTNEYTRDLFSGDKVYFLEYTYTVLAPPPLIEPKEEGWNKGMKENLDFYNSIVEESTKGTKNVCLRITKRGSKWFILGTQPPKERELRMMFGKLEDVNDKTQEYPTLLE